MGKLPAIRATKAYNTEMKRILNNAPKRNPPKPAAICEGAADTLTQVQKFEQAARDHGTDESEDAFRGVLRKLAKPKDETN